MTGASPISYLHPVFPWERTDGSVDYVWLTVSVLVVLLVVGVAARLVVKLLKNLFDR